MPLKNDVFIEINGEKVPIAIQEPGPVEVVQLPPPPSSIRAYHQPVGHCIYCGATNQLSDEHIIPYGLSGVEVLPKASCADCARETCKFEQEVLRGPMRAARIHRRLKSRTKHTEGPLTQRATLIRESGEEEIDLPLSEYPILLHFPTFAQPGHLIGRFGTGITMTGMVTVLFGPTPEAVALKHGAREIRFPNSPMKPIAYARMIAKIGLGFAVAGGFLTSIEGTSPVASCIHGSSDDVGQWVFTDGSDPIRIPGYLHRIQMHHMNGFLIAEVHLFADSCAPRYGVVLGKLKQFVADGPTHQTA